MEFLMELLFGLLFEAPAEAIMESKRVKPWVKTTLFLVVGLSLSVLFGFMALSIAAGGDNAAGAIAVGVICVAWTVFIIGGAVYQHKRQWKKA